jgi:uncharacterized protein (DUF924 family)
MPEQRDQAVEVLNFWFGETQPCQWFDKDTAFDDLVRQRFLSLNRRAIAGELDAWDAEPTRAVARQRHGLRWRSPGPGIEPAGGSSG